MDECSALNGTCEHICVNTQGSFQCSCRPGYQLHIDGHTCVGQSRPGALSSLTAVYLLISVILSRLMYPHAAETKASMNMLSHVISFSVCLCARFSQESLAQRGVSKICLPRLCVCLCVCTHADIDECKLQNGGCSHTCSNSLGGHFCHCPPPLLLDTDNLTCSSKFLITVLTSCYLDFSGFYQEIAAMNDSCLEYENNTLPSQTVFPLSLYLYVLCTLCSIRSSFIGQSCEHIQGIWVCLDFVCHLKVVQ